MGLMDRLTEPLAKRAAGKILTDLKQIEKADSSALVTPAGKPGVLRYTFDPVYVNSNYYNKKKPDSTITFDVLRNFSLKYEIVRACVNLRKRQLAGMEWDVVTAETNDTNDYTADILTAKNFIMHLGGTPDQHGNIVGGSYRRWMNMIVEDLMCLDALALYNVRANDNSLLTLLPVDATTIRLMINGIGTPPPPPAIAYKQVIRGTVTAELTTNELRYDMMNPRTNSPYGLSPLESLMITVTSALKSGLYNLSYLTDGNIPEGLVEAPANWNATLIKEFEKNWNAALSGDDGATRKLHWLPADSKYIPTKKPEDMAFEQFNTWLMKLTCAVFDVMPIDIGFPDKNKGLGDKGANAMQKDNSDDRGLRPLANIIEEILDQVIQEELGLPHLRFSFTGLDVENLEDAANVNQTLIFSGQRTINEIRTNDGLDSIDGGDALFIAAPGTPTPLNQEAIDAFGGLGHEDPENKRHGQARGDEASEDAATRSADSKPKKDKPSGQDDGSAGDSTADFDMSRKTDETFIKLVSELRTLRKYTKNRFKTGKPLRPFESNILPKSTATEINKRLAKAVDAEEADGIIKEYMTDYQVDFIHKVNKLRTELGVLV